MYDRTLLTPSKKYLGVYWHSGLRKFRAQIKRHGTLNIIGYYLSERDAALAFNAAVRERDGRNGSFLLSPINFIVHERESSRP